MKTTKSKVSSTLCKKCAEKQRELKKDSSKCSCAQCDSLRCFALRNKDQCSCNPTCQGTPSCINRKKSNTEVVDKKSITDLAFTVQQKVSKIGNSDSTTTELIKKEITYEYSNNGNTSNIMKHTRYSYSGVDPREKGRVTNEIYSDRPQAHSTTAVFLRKEVDSDTAELSAQIMNVPYREFKETISFKKCEIPSSKNAKLSKFDIFNRIKEAYKACSCKVCECLAGKSLPPARNYYCKCEPCGCRDCVTLLKNLNYRGSRKRPFIGCPCIRCQRAQCKGIVKETGTPLEFCDCDPCDCLKCSDSLTKPCNCQPCECIECKSYAVAKPRTTNTIVVSTMREDVPRSYCQCSPCDCADCSQDYPMSSSLRHEMATGINRPINCICDNCASQSCEANAHSCTCEVQKQIMRKPIEKDTRDYDIHRASVKKIGVPEINTKTDTIAMFAAVENNYENFTAKKKKLCSCGHCECIVCSCKETESLNKSRWLQPLQHLYKLPNNGTCKCWPCECEVCSDVTKGNSEPDQCSHKRICKCDTCDCLHCVHSSMPGTSNAEDNMAKFKEQLNNYACKCSPCECVDCQHVKYKCTGDSPYFTVPEHSMYPDYNFINETVYSNKTGCFSFPWKYEIKVNDEHNTDTIVFKSTEKIKTDSTSNPSRNNVSHKQACFNFEELNDNPVKDVNETGNCKSSQYIVQTNERSILSYDTRVQHKDSNIIMQYCNKKATDCLSSASIIEKNSFKSDKHNYVDESSNIPPILVQQCTSYELNPIQKNNSFRFPDISISKCLNNFMKFNVDTEKDSKATNDGKDTQSQICNGIKTINNDSLKQDSGKQYINVNILPICIDNFNKSMSFESDEHRITCVRDLSLNLVKSLKSANKRLSNLINPKLAQNTSTLRTSKASITLCNKLSNSKVHVNDQSIVSSGLNKNDKNFYQDLSDVHIDYDKINSTLQQAKTFSDELIHVLNEYKRANQLFVTKSLRQEQSNNHYERKIQSCDKVNGIDNLCDSIYNIKREPSLTNFDSLKKYGMHNLNIQRLRSYVSEKEDSSIKKVDNTDNLNSKISITNVGLDDHGEDIQSTNTIKSTVLNQVVCSLNGTKLNIIASTSKEDNPQCDNRSCEKLPISSSEDKRKNRSDKRSNKGGIRLRMPQSSVLYKRLKLKEALMNLASEWNQNGTELPPEADPIKPDPTDSFNGAIAKETQAYNSLQDHHEIATSTTGTEEPEKIDNQQLAQMICEADENVKWSILRKNCLLNTLHTQSRGFSQIPPLQLEIKDTLRAISRLQHEVRRRESEVELAKQGLEILKENKNNDVSIESSTEWERPGSSLRKSKFDLEQKDFSVASSQTCNTTISAEKAVDCMDDTFSLLVLKRQIKELLGSKLNVDHAAAKKSLNTVADFGGRPGKSGTISAKGSRDPLKVQFISLRKVSEQTVLVKWKAPLDVRNVDGYELLVDGRTVQKIINPSRCMAVVTCLPHVDKVLITIRTLVSSVVQCAHYPSSTIVYRMRVK